MKVLITGGTVFVSKFIAKYFAENGDEVFVLNRNTKPQLPNVKLIECDRRTIGAKIKGLRFDAVIDVTAYTAEDIESLLECLGSFDDYVMISSSAVYPETLKLPFHETDACGKNKFWGNYGLNKIAAEHALLNKAPHAYILRPPYLYGEYNNIYREAFVFDCAERNMPFYLPQDGSMPLQFFHVENLCRMIHLLLTNHPKQNVINVGNLPVTVKEWVETCYSAAEKTPTFVNVPSDIEQRKYFPFYRYVYYLETALQNELMPDLIPMDVGLRREFEWYKNNKNTVTPKNYFEFIERNLR